MPKRNEPKKEWKEPKITSTPHAPEKVEPKITSTSRAPVPVVEKKIVHDDAALDAAKDQLSGLEAELADVKEERDALAKRVLELESAPKGSEQAKDKAEVESVRAENRKYIAWILDVQKTGIVNYGSIAGVLKK